MKLRSHLLSPSGGRERLETFEFVSEERQARVVSLSSRDTALFPGVPAHMRPIEGQYYLVLIVSSLTWIASSY